VADKVDQRRTAAHTPLADRGIRAAVTGFAVDTPVALLAHPRGGLLAQIGSRRGLIVNAAAATTFRRLATTGVLSGTIMPVRRRADERLLQLLVAHGLARRELSLLEPFPPVAVVVPAYGRVETLVRCLDSLRGLAYPPDLIDLVVVDDAHPDPAATAAVARAVGSRLIRRGTNGGPAAARNTGVASTAAPVIGFVDSDCEVPADWLTELLPQLADPSVWGVAARVVGIPDGTALGAYEQVRSPLDMGAEAHNLDPMGGRLFVPSANLIAARDALMYVRGFDESRRIGEDVDLCLRMIEAGGRIRYLPQPTVGHARRRSVAAFARQRLTYAASEPTLVERHRALERTLPLPVVPLAAGLVLAGRPLGGPLPVRALVGGSLLAVQVEAWSSWSRRSWVTTEGALARRARTLRATLAANGRLVDSLIGQLARHHLLLASLAGGRGRMKPSLGVAAALLLAAATSDYVRLRPRLDVARFAALHAVDDIAYNAGLMVGAVRVRSATAILGRVHVTSGLPGRPKDTVSDR
jgi:mycofactocin system glycosyltransferase